MSNVIKRNRLFPVTAIAVIALILTSCAGQQQRENWPSHIPPLSYYDQIYFSDAANRKEQSRDNYLTWVKRFYLGWALYPAGWDWLTARAMRDANSDQERQLLKVRLASIGKQVSGEWAKDGKHRAINTSHLMTWGNALKLAIKRGQADRLTTSVSEDVDALLAGELAPADIEFDRYFPGTAASDTAVAIASDDTEIDDPFDG